MYLHVATPDLDGGLARGGGGEGLVEGPDAVVLGQGQGAQGTVEGAAGGGDERLLHEEVEVHLPDARHLVEQDEGALEQGIDLDIVRSVLCGVLGGQVGGAQLEVELPELVGARQGGAGALEHEGLLEEAAARLLEVEVVEPGLDGAGVALDVVLVGDVLVGDEEEVVGALHLALGRARQARRDGAEELARHRVAGNGFGGVPDAGVGTENGEGGGLAVRWFEVVVAARGCTGRWSPAEVKLQRIDRSQSAGGRAGASNSASNRASNSRARARC